MQNRITTENLAICLDNVPQEQTMNYIAIANNFGITRYEAPAYNKALMMLPGVVAIKSIFPSEFNNLFADGKKMSRAISHIKQILVECPDTVKAINFGCPGVKGKIPESDFDRRMHFMMFDVFMTEIAKVIFSIRQTRNMPDLVFCLEPTALQYGSNMLTTPKEVMEIIDSNLSGDTIKMLFDIGNEATTQLENPEQSLKEFGNIPMQIGHYHISSVNIGDVLYSENICDETLLSFYENAEIIAKEAYNNSVDSPYVSLESKMRSGQTFNDIEEDIEAFVKRILY